MDPLSIAVSVLTLATFCVHSSASLYKTIDGLKSRKQDVRYLKTEVGDLNVVLQALEKNIEESADNFELLRLVLQHCGQACKDFEDTVLQALGESDGRLQDFKNWAKLQYMGSNINDFRKLMSSYKATVTIALADYNLRTSRVTKQLLEKYTEMTEETTSDLEEQIEDLSTRLQSLQSVRYSTDGSETQLKDTLPIAQQTLNQKVSLEQCLNICHSLLGHIEEVKASGFEDNANASATLTADSFTDGVNLLAPRLTSDALKICTHNLNATAQQLQDLRNEKKPISDSDEARLMLQLNSAQQCLEVVSKAQHRVNIYENINTAEDAFQTVVSTIGDLIRANGLTIGARSVNIMGQMNDDTLQKLASNFRPAISKRSMPMKTKVSFEGSQRPDNTMPPQKS